MADLQSWPARRWMITVGVTVAALLALAGASGSVAPTGGPITPTWWGALAALCGAGFVGMIVASYFGTPVGSDATLCDTRWPVLGLIALHLATDARSPEPFLTGPARPVFAVAAVALLAWALRERLASEHRANAERDANTVTTDDDACTACRPLFSRSRSRRISRSNDKSCCQPSSD